MSYFATCNQFFCLQDCCTWNVLNIKARHEIQNSWWLIHLIAFDIDWSWNVFTSHNFLLNAHRNSSTSKKWKLITWNLGQIVEIELWRAGQYHSRWMFTKADCSTNLHFENQSSSCQRWSLHGFQISQFICDRFGCKLWLLSIQNHVWLSLTSFLSFCAPPSEVAVLFDLNLCRRPSSDRSSIYLLHWTGFDSEHAVLFLCHSFTQRPMTDRKIERSNGRCFGRQQLLANSIEIFISHEKITWLVAARNLQSIKTSLNLGLSQYRKSGSMFSSSEPLLPAATAAAVLPTRKRPVFVLASPTRASRAGERPQKLGRWFSPLNLRLPSGTAFGEIVRWQAGVQTWTRTWALPPDKRVVNVL